MHHPTRPIHFHAILLAIILLASFILKVPYIDDYINNPDEGWQVLAASAPDWISAWQRNMAGITHPPFIILLIHGLLQIGDAIWLPKLASLTANLLLAFAGYHLGKAATQSRNIGLLLAMALTFSPPINALALVIRGYTYMLLFLVSALVFYVRYIRKGRSKDLLFYTLCMGMALFSEYVSCLVVFACGLVHGLFLLRAEGITSRKLLNWALLHAALAGWFLLLYSQHPFTFGPDKWVSNFPVYAFSYITVFMLFYPLIAFGFLETLATLCTLGSINKLRKHYFPLTYFLIIFVLLIALSFLANAFDIYPIYPFSRHTLYLAPFILLIIYYGLVKSLKESAGEERWLPILVLGLHIAGNMSIFNVAQSSEFMFARSELPPLEKALKALPKNSIVLMDTQPYFMLFNTPIVDEISTDSTFITMRIGNASLKKLNQEAMRLVHADGSVDGNFFLTAEDLEKMLTELPQPREKLYLLEMGFQHGLLSNICQIEASYYLESQYVAPRTRLYALTPENGRRLARECRIRLEKEHPKE